MKHNCRQVPFFVCVNSISYFLILLCFNMPHFCVEVNFNLRLKCEHWYIGLEITACFNELISCKLCSVDSYSSAVTLPVLIIHKVVNCYSIQLWFNQAQEFCIVSPSLDPGATGKNNEICCVLHRVFQVPLPNGLYTTRICNWNIYSTKLCPFNNFLPKFVNNT